MSNPRAMARNGGKQRVCIIGLDCLTPQLLFDSYRDALPHVSALLEQGSFGPLESCVPPITIPAWPCMVTGTDPGALGLYGFRGRADHSYEQRALATSLSYQPLPLWSHLSRAGLRCNVLGVPGTWPARPVRGRLVSGMLTPDDADDWAHPPELMAEIERTTGRPTFDVADFRTASPERLAARIRAMSDEHFDLAERWMDQGDDWDFFMMVEIGPDRVQHAFWQYAHADHRGFVPDHPYADAIRDYYRYLDRRVGALVDRLHPDDLLLLVSDHGAQSMRGGIAINQWLLERGDLTLRAVPEEPTSLHTDAVDWTQTRAWADGGYVGRVYLNIAGREPQGILPLDRATAFADELISALGEIRGVDDESLATRAWRAEQLYDAPKGVPPDVTVAFDDLAYRALGSVGHPRVALAENDRGADGANHARDGIFILRHGTGRGRRYRASLFDIAPTVLDFFGLPIPDEMRGTSLLEGSSSLIVTTER